MRQSMTIYTKQEPRQIKVGDTVQYHSWHDVTQPVVRTEIVCEIHDFDVVLDQEGCRRRIPIQSYAKSLYAGSWTVKTAQ